MGIGQWNIGDEIDADDYMNEQAKAREKLMDELFGD